MAEKKWVQLSVRNVRQVVCGFSKMKHIDYDTEQFIPLRIEFASNYYYIYTKRTNKGIYEECAFFPPYVPVNWRTTLQFKHAELTYGGKSIKVCDTYDDLKEELKELLLDTIMESNLLDVIIEYAYGISTIHRSQFKYSIGDTKDDLRNELYIRSGPFVDVQVFYSSYVGDCYIGAYDEFEKDVYYGFGNSICRTNLEYQEQFNVLTMASTSLDSRFQRAVDFTFYYDKYDKCIRIRLVERGQTIVTYDIKKIFLNYCARKSSIDPYGY